MIDPKTVLVGIPCHDGRMMTELAGMLIQNRDLFGGYTMPTECSHPSIARNTIADTFERSPFEWLLAIDSDIVPQRPDLLLMLEEIDSTEEYIDPEEPEHSVDRVLAPNRSPRPTRIDVPLQYHDSQTGKFVSSKRGFADALVCSEYAYRWDPYRVVKLGGGFYRVHRSVFSVLKQLAHEDNGRVEVDAEALNQLIDVIPAQVDPQSDQGQCYVPLKVIQQLRRSRSSQAGTPRLWQCTFQGRTFYDYYPSGPLINLLVPIGEWKGEDHGFWTLCMLAGLIPRIETRTRVLHIGRKAYPYLGPESQQPLQYDDPSLGGHRS
jgi:hypothetical protein